MASGIRSTQLILKKEVLSSGGATGDWGDSSPLILKSRQKLSMKTGIKLVGYTFRLKNYVKTPPFLSDFSELAPPLVLSHLESSVKGNLDVKSCLKESLAL